MQSNLPLPSERWLNLLPDAALIADQDGFVQTVNTQVLNLFGYTSDELLQQPIEILIPERARAAHTTHRGGFFADPRARPMGARMDLFGRRKDGSEFPAEVSISPIEGDGQTRVCAIIRDISDRITADVDRREREARLQVIFDSASDVQVLFRAHPGGRLIVEMANRAMKVRFRQVTGLDDYQFVGTELDDLLQAMRFSPEAVESRRSMCLKAAREKTAIEYTGSAGPNSDDVEAVISPVLNQRGECTHVLWNARVVTDRIRAEAELREREERLRTIFNSHQDLQMLVRLEPDGRFVNEAFNQATYDYAREFIPDAGAFLERERQDLLRAFGVEESLIEKSLQAWRKAASEKIPLHFELNSTVGNGKRREMADVSLVPILNRAGACTHLLWTAHMMTERLLAAEELQRRERELGEAQSIGHIGSWTWNIADGKKLIWSDEVYRILGYAPQAFPPPDFPGFLKMVHPDDREAVEKRAWAAFEARESHDIEHRIVRPDGTIRYVRSRSRIQLDPAGNPLRLVATIHDITEEKEAAAREAKRLERLQKLSELSMMLAGDPTTVLQRIVRMIGELFSTRGVSLSEIEGNEALVRAVYVDGRVDPGSARCPLEITPCATVAAARDIRIYDHVQEKFPRATYLALFDAYVWCGFPSFDDEGNVVAVTSLMDDKPREFSAEDQHILRLIGQRIAVEFERAKRVTERARMEEALRENQTRLEEAQHMAHLGSWYSRDAETGAMQWSPELYRIYEADPATETPADLVMSRTHPDDRARVQETREALLKGSGGFESEYRLQMPDGRIKNVIVQGNVSAGPDGKTQMGGTVQDITERKRAQQERENLQTQLAQAQKMESIGRLAGGIAHDFNNMLTVILGYAALCRKEMAYDPKLERQMGEIVKAATRSKEITEKLLGFSRQQIIVPVPSNLNEIVVDFKEPLSRLIGEHIELIFNPRAGLWKIVVDATQINQILLNLAVNARDAMPHGGKLRVEAANVDVSEEFCRRQPEARRGRYVLLTVRDTGVGMDRETMSHIFEPFYTTRHSNKGTGLGLATVYGIVQQNGGFITVESELQIGTVFRIYFPKMIGDEVPASAPADSRPMHAGQGTVLLLEDDEPVRELTKATLEAMGYTPLVAENAKHAIECCAGKRGQDIRMVLTDVVMPDMNGMELRDRILEINPAIRVLFMSGYTPNVIVNQGVLKKGVHFIQKPFTIEDLGRRVEEVLTAE